MFSATFLPHAFSFIVSDVIKYWCYNAVGHKQFNCIGLYLFIKAIFFIHGQWLDISWGDLCSHLNFRHVLEHTERHFLTHVLLPVFSNSLLFYFSKKLGITTWKYYCWYIVAYQYLDRYLDSQWITVLCLTAMPVWPSERKGGMVTDSPCFINSQIQKCFCCAHFFHSS